MLKRGMPLLSIVLLMAACSNKTEQPQASAEPVVHDIMKDKIDANADQVWELTNGALDNDANLDGSKLDDATWDKIAQHAQAVSDAANELVNLKTLTLIRPGETIADQDVVGGTTPEKVQDYLNAKSDDFRQYAGVLASHMADMAADAKAHDAKKMGPLVDQLDGVCENCHLEFWYPDQRAYVESVRKKNGDDPTS
jgi:hypothetical protein